MEKPPKYEPLFPKDLDHLNKKFEKLQQTLEAIDYELDSPRMDEGPSLKYRPAGPEGRDTTMRERRTQFVTYTREKRVAGYRRQLEKDTAGLGEKERQIIISRYDYQTSRNPFKTYTKENLNEVRGNEKKVEVATDYMAALHFSKYHIPEKSAADEKENIDDWSKRYLTLLDNYSLRSESPGMGISKDDLEIECSK